MTVKLAILFWFYKDFDLCAGRLRSLRRFNPDVPIYGLYGGPQGETAAARQRLGYLLDDFYAYEGPEDPRWRWRNGDRVIAAWFSATQSRLAGWDSVIVVQWDMLVFGPVRRIFHMLRPGEVLLSGLRPASEVEAWWHWLKPDSIERPVADAFKARIRKDFGYGGELWACLFIVVCLPRRFLELYAASGPVEEGFLEYKVPTMAKIWNFPLCTDHPFLPLWLPESQDSSGSRLLNANRIEITLAEALREAARRDRIGLIHPHGGPFPWWFAMRPVAWILSRSAALRALTLRLLA